MKKEIHDCFPIALNFLAGRNALKKKDTVAWSHAVQSHIDHPTPANLQHAITVKNHLIEQAGFDPKQSQIIPKSKITRRLLRSLLDISAQGAAILGISKTGSNETHAIALSARPDRKGFLVGGRLNDGTLVRGSGYYVARFTIKDFRNFYNGGIEIYPKKTKK